MGCDLHLHAEVELLRQTLLDKQSQLMDMETQCMRETDRQAELEDSLVAWQDKYDRLYESHKRVQKVNEGLEDKLLKLADRNSGERAQLTSDVATLSVRLAQANYNITNLRREIDRYKTDMNLAIQLLRCNQENFVPPKISSLPRDMQTKLNALGRIDSDTESLAGERRGNNFMSLATSPDSRSNVMYRVVPASESPPPPGVCPFPPTAMVYSMRGVDAKIDDDQVTRGLIAKYLEEQILSSDSQYPLKSGEHCRTCQCKDTATDAALAASATIDQSTYSVGTQTAVRGDSTNNSLCLRCNSNLNSPSRSSPYIMKLGLKSADSAISSDSKSALSTPSNREEEEIISGRRDELQVNPILGHHRLCDRSNLANNAKSSQTTEVIVPTMSSAGPVKPKSISVGGGGVGTAVNVKPELEESSFNNVLIKNIKMSEHMGKSMNRPRLCSIRIDAEGAATTNILLDNAEMGSRLKCDSVSIVSQPLKTTTATTGTVEKQVYTKRSKYLDEELDDTKEVILCVDKKPGESTCVVNQFPVAESSSSPGKESQRALIELTNKTDSEKYRESVQQHNGSSAKVDGSEGVVGICGGVGGGGGGGVGDQSAFLLDDPVPLVENLHVMDMTMGGGGGGSVAKSTIALRQEQLDRVAVWVQQSNEQQQHQQQANVADNNNGHNNRKCSNHSELSGSNVSQLTTPVSYSTSGDVCIDIDGDVVGGEGATTTTTSPLPLPAPSPPMVDSEIAQMEYNVKQFLLKQNEWSIGRAASPVMSAGAAVGSNNNHLRGAIGNMYSPSSSMSFSTSNNLRTETNL